MSRGRLRVAVPGPLLEGSAGGGHGRVWREVLRELDSRVRLVRGGSGRRRPDVWLADGHAGAEGLGSPLVVQVHEAPWDDPSLEPEFGALMRERTGAAVAAADRVITAAQSAREEIEAAHGARAVDVVGHGVDPAVFRPGAPEEKTASVLFVGTVHPRKNLPALREAMAALARDGRPHLLELVLSPAPDRADSSELLAAARAELPGGVRVHEGLRDRDLAALMGRAAVVCVPSRSEGFGLAALEAMACGTPVVAGDGGALPEVVGDAGLVVEPTPDAIRDGLARILHDPQLAADLRRRGLDRAASRTWAATADGWLASLRRAAGGA